MNAIKNIMDTLTACGCKPAATVDNNGDTIIKINAPAVPVRYYVIKEWCDAPTVTDHLLALKIPFATSILSRTKLKIEINAEDLPRALNICNEWRH